MQKAFHLIFSLFFMSWFGCLPKEAPRTDVQCQAEVDSLFGEIKALRLKVFNEKQMLWITRSQTDELSKELNEIETDIKFLIMDRKEGN